MRALAPVLALALALAQALVLAAPAFAQRRDDWRGQPPARWPQGQDARQGMSQEQRQRLRQDVDSARGNYGRAERQRPQQRLAPEEREQLRRDVQDANRDLRRR